MRMPQNVQANCRLNLGYSAGCLNWAVLFGVLLGGAVLFRKDQISSIQAEGVIERCAKDSEQPVTVKAQTSV